MNEIDKYYFSHLITCHLVPILERHQSGLAAISPDHAIENLHQSVDKLKQTLNSRSKGKIIFTIEKLRRTVFKDVDKKKQIKTFDQSVFVKKNEGILRLHPQNLKEKLFKKDQTKTAKLSKTQIGQILTKRNNDVVDITSEDIDQATSLQEQDIRGKNATVSIKNEK